MEGDGHPDSMVLPLLVSLTETARLICFPYVPPVHVSRKRDWRSRDAHLNDKGGGGVGAQSRGGEMLQVVAYRKTQRDL